VVPRVAHVGPAVDLVVQNACACCCCSPTHERVALPVPGTRDVALRTECKRMFFSLFLWFGGGGAVLLYLGHVAERLVMGGEGDETRLRMAVGDDA
jgi:hypothetical protein